MAIKFGVFVPQGWRMDLLDFADPVEKYEAMTRVGQEAERLGYDSIWVYDHFHTVPTPELESVFECWTITAGLARDTKTIRLGQMVTCNGYRNPALLAKIASTVDVLSHGRLDFGIGAGWYEHEYRAYGYDYPDGPTRLKMLGDALQIIHAMWAAPYATVEGAYHRVRGAINEPKGVQKPHPPIWVGGGGEKVTLKLVAKYADACNVGGWDPDVYRHKFSVVREHCATVGRDYSAILKSSEVFLYLTDHPERIDQEIAHLSPAVQEEIHSRFLVATPATAKSRLLALVDAGVEYFIVYLFNAARLEPVQQFAQEVRPAFR
ncbi:MAG TPA: LLM class F420-dependent oxidoreductase [Chloroflexia bacterium]|nr:LLM class F420-dependent oxidoreductase [Chloroflexia bacterium]